MDFKIFVRDLDNVWFVMRMRFVRMRLSISVSRHNICANVVHERMLRSAENVSVVDDTVV